VNAAGRGVPGAEAVRAAFDAKARDTVGVEEELMLLDPASGDLVPAAAQVLDLLDGDPRFKLEMPAAQLEIVTEPAATVAEIESALRLGRESLARATESVVRLAAAGVHPVAAAEGALNPGPRYDRTARQYGFVASRQLVFALQVHVAPGSAERALAVYNALRSYLPEIAALAANAPFHEGRDTGLASIRPLIAGLLPRQGVPPAIATWEGYAEALAWGRTAGTTPDAGAWWWELRPSPRFGTLEFRVPDAQTTVAEAAAIAAVAQALAATLGRRFDAGEALAVAPGWRIAENRWSALRDGVEGSLADLESGERRPTRERLRGVLDELEPAAAELGCAEQLDRARGLIDENGAMRQRTVAARRGSARLVDWLAESWLA
jgi:carboxylate-amine ligase